MLTEPQRMWVAALRSGDYKQGTGALCRGGLYCCLGVGCDLYVKHVDPAFPVKVVYGSHHYGLDDDSGLLPDPVRNWLGLQDDWGSFLDEGGWGTELTSLNDCDKTFAEIADIIESEPEGLFVAEDSQTAATAG